MTKATMGICGEIIINPIWGCGWHSSQKVILRWREALVPAASFSRYTGVLKFEIGHTVSFTRKKHDFVYAVSQVSFRFGYIEKSWRGGNFWYTGLITSGVMLYYHTLSRTLTKTVICMIAIWLKSGLPVSVELQTQDNDTDEFKIPHFFPTSKDTNVILRPYDIKKTVQLLTAASPSFRWVMSLLCVPSTPLNICLPASQFCWHWLSR